MDPKQSYNQTLERAWRGAEPIAIVGMAGRFPKAKDVREFWSRLSNAEDCISRLTSDDLRTQGVDPVILDDPNYVAAAPVLQDVEQFDAAFFGITPREAELMDPQQRIFLECCWEALEDAGYAPKSGCQATGVFAGARTDTYLFNILSHPTLARAIGAFHIGLGNDLAFLTTRVSHLLNLTGPSLSVHTACSTSLVAVHLACEALRQHHCDAALAGGVAINIPHYVGYMYEEGSVQSPDGYCRTFDASARGTVFGSGAGVILLKRLADAIASRDSIYAIIRGSAINNDGSDKASFTAPSVQGQVNVICDALRASEIDPDTIGYVECHGTGTLLGDAIEVRALVKAFGKGVEASCAIGSVKTNVGHLDAAAGMTGLIKTALSLKHQMIPASLHYVKPNPQINFEGTRFYVNTSTSKWLSRGIPRRAGVSAFGVGGTNAHIVLEEAPPVTVFEESEDLQVLPLSARSGAALADATRSLSDHLRDYSSQLALPDIAFTLQEGRHAFEFRHALVCRSVEEAIAELRDNCPPPEAFQSSADVPPEVTFLFPGQGAQYIGMGKDLYEKEPVYRTQIRECSDILRPWLQQDLVSVLYESSPSQEDLPELDLAQTWLAQPAIVAVEYALAKLWMSWGVRPQAMFGHSVGEYTAAVLSGVMSIEDALRLVAVRGQLMQQTAPGAMLAVPLSEEDVTPWLFGGLSIAAFNAPELCTIAGSPEEIRVLETELKAGGIACQLLRTSHAFHTAFVEPAMAPFVAEIRKIRLNRPTIPFISCVTGTWIRSEEAQQPEYWSQQMRLPVQFETGLTEILGDANNVLLDVGPGQTLRRLALRRSRSSAFCRVVGAMPPTSALSEQHSILKALGELWVSGVTVNWGTVRRGERRRVSLPTYPFERSRFWIDPVAASNQVSISLDQNGRAPVTQKDPDISKWFWIPSPRLTSPVLGVQADGGGWLVYCDRVGLAEQVCLDLEMAGERVIRVAAGSDFHRVGNLAYEIDPLARKQHENLWDSLLESETEIGNVISFSTMNHAESGDADTAQSTQPHVPDLISSDLFGIQAMLSRSNDRPRKYFVVSTGLMDIEHADQIDPAKATMVGLVSTLKDEEYQKHEYRLIDVARNADQGERIQTAKQIVEEIRSDATEEVVAYRGKRRWVRDFKQVPILRHPHSANAQSETGAYLILGGLGTVGLLVAQHLANAGHPKLVLTSRTPLPPRSKWAEAIRTNPASILAHRIRSVLQLEEAGAEVDTIEVDIADHGQVAHALSYVEGKHGQVRGIIHTAGVTSGRSAFCIWARLELQDFSEQLRAKLLGLQVLADVIRNKNVPLVLLMSSNSSLVGGLGFAAYAAANSFMNAFAEKRTKEQQGTRWLSVSWDHWPEFKAGDTSFDLAEFYGDLTEGEISRALELKYRYAMSRDEVETALSYIFDFQGSGHLIVSAGNLPERVSSISSLPVNYDDRSNENNGSSHSRTQRPKLKNVLVAPRNELETKLAAIWADFLGLEQVGIHDDFFELGGHSLLATKLVAHVRTALGSELPLAKLFEGPTIAQMAENVLTSTETVSK